jgi:hypothetical protein
MQWVIAVEDCEGTACGCTMAGMWTMQPEAQTTTPWFPAVRTGALEIAYAVKGAKQVHDLSLLTFLPFILHEFSEFPFVASKSNAVVRAPRLLL